MSWITLTVDDIYTYLAADQVDALRMEALAVGQDDPLPQIIADVVERVRAEVRAYHGNQVSATEGTIPPELRSAVVALVIEAAQARLPGLELTSDQIRAGSYAKDLMRRVIIGEVPVTEPDDPLPQPASGPFGGVAVLGSRRGSLSSRSLAGL